MSTQAISWNNTLNRGLKTALYYSVLLAFSVSCLVVPVSGEVVMPDVQIKNIIQKSTEYDVANKELDWTNSLKVRYPNAEIKTITQGVKHIKLIKYINSCPIKINVIEINQRLNKDLKLEPMLAAQNLKSKAKISEIAQGENTIAAINGTYFSPPTGIPLGLLVKDGNVLTGPIYNRTALGIFENDIKIAQPELSIIIRTRDGAVLNVDNINQPRMLSTYILVYTDLWGKFSPATPKNGIQIAIKENKIVKISDGSIEIPKDGYVISGPTEKLEPFFNAKNLKLEISMPQWKNVRHVISGGPYLIKDGNVYVDVAVQKLSSIEGRNPRTAVGISNDGKVFLVTVDGREKNSIGMTLYELAMFLKSLGAENALNLDGGGSSVMYINGLVVNNPAINGGIYLSNILALTTTNSAWIQAQK